MSFKTFTLSLALLLALASAAVAHPTLLTSVETMVARMRPLDMLLPDLNARDKQSTQGMNYTYYSDFSCVNGTVRASGFTLDGFPQLTGDEDAAQLDFNLSIGTLSLMFDRCEEVIRYPVSGAGKRFYQQGVDFLTGAPAEGFCSIALRRNGFSCTASSSFRVLANATKAVMSWLDDCPACETSILEHVGATLGAAMVPVIDGVAAESELCYFLD